MTTDQVVQAKPKRRKIWVLVLVSVAVVVFSVPVILNIPNFRGMFEAKKVFNAYHHALIKKDYTVAYNFLAPETRANVSYDRFAAIEDKLGERVGALKSFSTSEMDTKGDEDNRVTTIQARLRFEKGSLDFEYVLKEEQGIWFVYRFNEL